MLSKANLKAHVGDVVRLGRFGTESTDNYSVMLRVPYLKPSPVSDVAIPADKLTDMDKALGASLTMVRKDPAAGSVEVSMDGDQVLLQGRDKNRRDVSMKCESVDPPPPLPDFTEEPGQLVTLHVDALEKLLKALKVTGAKALELGLSKSGWQRDEQTEPVSVRVLDEESKEIARGCIMPAIHTRRDVPDRKAESDDQSAIPPGTGSVSPGAL